MTSFNRITLIGTVANDPDARVTNSGDPMLRFTVATERPAAEGMPVSVDYIPVIAWRQLAERKELVQKGALILVEGRISTRSFEDTQGRRKWTTEVEAREIRSVGAGADVFGAMPSLVPAASSVPTKKSATLERAPVDEVSLGDFDFGEPKPMAGYAAGPKYDAELDEDVPF